VGSDCTPEQSGTESELMDQSGRFQFIEAGKQIH
jgi:hypothetical protein